MKKGLTIVVFTMFICIAGCNQRGAKDAEIAMAKAQAETARLRIEAAKAEAQAAEAKKTRLQAEIQAREEQRKQEAETENRRARADAETRKNVGDNALRVVQRNGRAILNKAYPWLSRV